MAIIFILQPNLFAITGSKTQKQKHQEINQKADWINGGESNYMELKLKPNRA